MDKVLLAGIHPDDLEIAEFELTKSGTGYNSQKTYTFQGLKKSIREFNPDVVICSYSFYSGTESSQVLKDHNLTFIVVNDPGNELAAIECMKSGAADYITRDRIQSITSSIEDALEKRRKLLKNNKESLSLRPQEVLKSNLIDGVPYIALVIKKGTREIVACNKTALEAGAVVGKTCFETISKCNHACSFCKAPILWESGNEQRVKTEQWGKHWEGSWLKYSDDLYIHYIWDRTELVETREELQESRERISDALEFNRKILNSSSLGILTYHKSGKCITANSAAAKIVGTTVENVLKQNFHGIQSWKKSGMYQAALSTLETGDDHVLEIHDSSSFGKEVWINVSFSSFDSKGEQHILMIISDISERKKAENRLVKSENRFKSIFESNFISIAFWNNKGEFFDANAAYLNLTGYSRDDFKSGKVNWSKLTPPEYATLDQQGFQEICQNGFCKSYEQQYIRKDGSRIHVLVGGAFIEGMPGEGVTYAIDISQRKKTEKALQESEENMRYIIKHDPNSIVVFDRNLNYIAVSDLFLRHYSRKEEDIIGKHVYDVFPGVPQRWKDVHQRSLSGFVERNDDDYFEKADGSFSYNRWESRPWYLSNGEIGGIVVYNEVITERKLAEKALKEALHYVRNLIESNPDPLATIDSKGIITDVNAAMEIVTGYKRNKLVGSVFADYFTEPQLARKGYKTVFLKGTVRDYPLTLIHKSGRTREVLYNATIFKNTKGEIQGVFAAARDITELRKMEEKLRESKDSLEKLNNRLVEIRENERAMIARDLHDQLGQSLTALKLDINRIKNLINPDPEALTLLSSMVEMVSGIISDVQRITADLRPGILDDLGLVSAVDWYCGEFSARTGIKCRLRLENTAEIDSDQSLIFFRVLQEALTNIIRHAHATSVKINLRQSYKGTALSVQDNGRGITKEQADSRMSLGLVGIRERIKQYSGTLSISSKEGAGTKLTVFLPVKKI